jgi:hypothetical protein
MKNIFLDDRTARDIADRIARVHRDLDHRGGKVELTDVRTLLRLDLAFYKADDPGLLQEVVHRLRLGAKQVIERPSRLVEAVRKFDLRALFVPDRRQILIDDSLPNLKKRWSEGHEIVHSLVPWHAEYMLGDNKVTLAPSCHDQIEAEANFGTGRLFFPPTELLTLIQASPLDFRRIQAISAHFGNTITSTLWRCAEADLNPSFAVIGDHPHRRDASKPEIEHLVRSPNFARRFGRFEESQVMPLLRGYCGYQGGGPLGSGEIVLGDDNGDEHVFIAETFCNKHNTLTFAQYSRPRTIQIKTRVGGVAA